MSGPKFNRLVASRVAELFGSAIDSDCTVVFCSEESAERRDGSPRQSVKKARILKSPDTLGDPLPAHKVVLRNVSERFRAQLERWQTDQAATSTQHPAEGTSTQPRGSSAGALVLRIPLSSEDEVPAARAAIKFAYTGRVEAASVREALEVRRQAAYLQIEGCAAACDECISRSIIKLESKRMPRALSRKDGVKASGSHPGSDEQLTTTAALLQLYTCDDLWPAVDEDGSFKQIIASAKPMLVAHFKDTITTLNTPSLRQQLLGLGAEGLAALLGSDAFGTDFESTILLLLATWMTVNYAKTDAATRKRLCRLVRLVQLGPAYLTLVLPALALDHETQPEQPAGWFCVGVMEAAFVTQYTSVTEDCRRKMAEFAIWDLQSPTYIFSCRPTVILRDGFAFSWTIEQSAFEASLMTLAQKGSVEVYASFNSASTTHATFNGLNWGLSITLTSGLATAGLYLWCRLPAVFRLPSSRLTKHATGGAVARIFANVAVARAGNEKPVERSFTGDFCSVGHAAGWIDLLPLRQQLQGGNGDGESSTGGNKACNNAPAALSDYLRDGKITGTLELFRPNCA